ncbi:sugar porter family MFS transporter [Streptosporangium roseum]|uniref:Major facilitator superfamily permease/glucose transporter n=1 Tax=Streptosporangium roseum (strain ATCC 12428 / DSM 43021 / JCM 3005 / KCTC 9067 / NCIMB 10171 / NRRL 2505 / NI 9100) TaxID=479432 RepID=D2B5F4_STRRD|nr:sugar porter family MFS transporter [Streptosporangium roseum]ACZ89459.1 major facilitator superfamily permease/glucose transporter [Streptosporangium roseum DSM 43021]
MVGTASSGTSSEHLGHVVFITAAAALGGFLFGYDSAVINGAVTGIQKHFRVGPVEIGVVVAIALLGSAVGAWIAGGIADRWGRTRTMQVAALLFAVSSVGQALPFAIWDLAFWRVLAGVGIGMASVIGPAYIAEVAPPAYRGRLGSFQQLAIVLGIAVSQLVNYAIAQTAGGNVNNVLFGLQAWQWMLGACLVPALLYLLFSTIIPESPRFLIAIGKTEQARQVLREVEGDKVDLDSRVTEIYNLLRSERPPRIRDLRGPALGLLPIVWIGILLSVFQQFVGINVIFYYSSSLWQSVGINQSDSLLISFSTSIINIVGTFIAIALVDRIGRKPLLLIGSAGMAVALATAAWAFSAGVRTGDAVRLPETQGTVALVAAHVFVLFFALSWGVVVWVLLGEMFPNRIRAAALSVAASAQWVANWLITVSFPSLAAWNLSGAYVGYAFFAVLSFVFVLLKVKETKGRRLEEMG